MRLKISLIVFLVVMSLSFSNKENKEDKIVLVELFTSQGCSSCPKADEVLKQIKEKYKDGKVIPLSFHVDYWDRLGWKDTFSQPKFSDRQRDYAKKFKSRSIYTPQMIVNGITQFVGSHKSKAFDVIHRKLGGNQIRLDGNFSEDYTLNVTYNLPQTNLKAYDLHVALVKDKEQVSIKRGENWGKNITYHNIVYDFKSLEKIEENGRVSFKKPKGFNSKDFSVIMFLQENKNGEVVAVKKL